MDSPIPDSPELLSLFNLPLKLLSNRVWRTYTGGRLIDRWQGRRESDGPFPEEWIASITQARNPGLQGGYEGLSEVETPKHRLKLIDLIRSAPEALLGPKHVAAYGNDTGLLVKILDSAERLTIQVHPDPYTARKFFNSLYGKTEAWYVLGGREINNTKPYVLFGFKPHVTREKLRAFFEAQDTPAMVESLHKIYLETGQIFFIEGGMPHAIGPGCFLLEVQEPTDFTLRIEKTTPDGKKIPEDLCHQGIGFENVFDCFHYQSYSYEEVLESWVYMPRIIRQDSGGTVSALIDSRITRKFAVELIDVSTELIFENRDSFSIIIVLSGMGTIDNGKGKLVIHQGEQLFLPFQMNSFSLHRLDRNPFKLVRCWPPLP